MLERYQKFRKMKNDWDGSVKIIRMVYVFLILILVGCKDTTALLTERTEKQMKDEVKAFVEMTQKSNGIYLFSRVGEKQYLILNNLNVIQGDQASFIDSIQSEVQDATLIINLKELYTDNYEDKRIGKLRIFELDNDIKFENIKIFKNKKETKIDIVGG